MKQEVLSQVIEQYELGVPLNKIVAELNVKRPHITYYLKQLGLFVPERERMLKYIEDAREQGTSINEIATYLNTTPRAVQKHLDKLKVEEVST